MKKSCLAVFMASFCARSLFGWCEVPHGPIITNTIEGVTFYYFVDGNACTLYNNGSPAISGIVTGNVMIPPTLGGYPVTSIGYGAAGGLTSITSVAIPDTVKRLEYGAFQNCTALTNVIFNGFLEYADPSAFLGTPWYNNYPDGVVYLGHGAYWHKGDCPTNVVIRSDALVIGANAFKRCAWIQTVTLPEGLSQIGAGVFYGCTSLTNITIPGSVSQIGSGAFSETPWFENQPEGVVYAGKVLYKFKGVCPPRITIRPDTVSIAASAFQYCHGLQAITIPRSVTAIGDSAFNGCIGLTTLNIMDGVQSIGNYAFDYCYILSNVSIPPSLSTIGDDAFFNEDSYCGSIQSLVFDNADTTLLEAFNKQSLQSLFLGASVSNVTGAALMDCSALRTISVAANNVSYKSDTNGVLYTKDGEALVKVPPLADLSNFTVPAGVRSIGEFAFYGADALYALTLPEGVREIGDESFNWCLALESVRFPSSLTNIGDRAFEVCPSLRDFNFAGTPPVFGSDFCLWSAPTVYVPSSTAEWIAMGVQLGLEIVADSSSSNVVLSVGGVSITNLPGQAFFEGVSQQDVNACLGVYTNAFPAATADNVGRLLCTAEAMGLAMPVIAQGSNILLFSPALTLSNIELPANDNGLAQQTGALSTSLDQLAITFAVSNGITDPQTAVALLRDSVSRLLRVEYADSVTGFEGKTFMSLEASQLSFDTERGVVTATISMPSPRPLSGFYKLWLSNVN